MDHPQARNPMHGITLETMLEQLVATLGWEAMGQAVPIRCFTHDPSIASSLKFLRRTPWAREKVEGLYLSRAAPGTPAAPPVLDERALLAFSGGSRSAEADIFDQLLEESARDRALLQAAIGAGDDAQVRLIAHRIKGAHLLLGAAPLSAILQRIELAGARADWAAIRADLPSLELEFQRFDRFVRERLERA